MQDILRYATSLLPLRRPRNVVQRERDPDVPRHLFRARLYHLFHPSPAVAKKVVLMQPPPASETNPGPVFCPPITDGIVATRVPAMTCEKKVKSNRRCKLGPDQRPGAYEEHRESEDGNLVSLESASREFEKEERSGNDYGPLDGSVVEIDSDGFENCVVFGGDGDQQQALEVDDEDNDDRIAENTSERRIHQSGEYIRAENTSAPDSTSDTPDKDTDTSLRVTKQGPRPERRRS